MCVTQGDVVKGLTRQHEQVVLLKSPVIWRKAKGCKFIKVEKRVTWHFLNYSGDKEA